MRIRVKTKTKSEIPTASMPDIIFMLLVFFMVTTVLREFEGLPVTLPSAKQIQKLKSKRNTAHIFVSRDGLISIDDRLVPVLRVRNIVYAKLVERPKLTISLKADQSTPMNLISDIHTELRHANTLKVNYATKTRVD